MALKIYNTLSGKKEIFKPLKKTRVNFFVCGITPYDSPHLGHAKIYINMDMIAKYLRHKKYKLFYLQNLTDIDDKIIKRSQEKNISWDKLVENYWGEFGEIMATLKITSVSKYAKATDFIPQIIKQIQTLIKKDYAYETADGVYFDITKFQDYGKLSRQKISKLKSDMRIKTSETKKHPFDFDLWKKQKPGEPSWSSPWGNGRPGWHIEDTAISEHFFGSQYDLHGGADELKFPHHEAEIAQMEAASGKKPFVKYWLHGGVLTISGEKMSKSLGNFITIKNFLEKYPPEICRLMLLSSHYRSRMDYSEQIAIQAQSSLNRLTEFINKLDDIKKNPAKQNRKFSASSSSLNTALEKHKKSFFFQMDDDFNSPKALGVIFNFIKIFNKFIEKNQPYKQTVTEIKKFFSDVNKIFDILPDAREIKIPKKIIKITKEREKARQEKNWKLSDELRFEVEKSGYKIEDTENGPIIKKI